MKILLVDDHAVVRAGLSRMLAALANAEIHEASSGRDACALVRRQSLDLIILDLNLPELGGFELLERLRQLTPTPILVLSMHAEPLYVSRALEGGASGYLSKNVSPDELLLAVRRVGGGARYIETEIAQAVALQPATPPVSLNQLSARDLEILRHLAAGKSLGEIASALGLGYKTIANTCTAIKAKLGVARTADLLRIAMEAGVG